MSGNTERELLYEGTLNFVWSFPGTWLSPENWQVFLSKPEINCWCKNPVKLGRTNLFFLKHTHSLLLQPALLHITEVMCACSTELQKQNFDPLFRHNVQHPGSSASALTLLPNLQLWALHRAKSPLALSSNNSFWSLARDSCQFQSHSANARGRVY